MHRRPALLLLTGCILAGAAQAQSAVLSGVLGGKALLVVDGGPPRSVAVGQSHQGVKVIAVGASQAEVEIQGVRQTLRMGEGPVGLEDDVAGRGDGRIVLQAVSNGHFMTLGQINGHSVRFLVDTGASYVALGAAEAERLGINLRAAQAGVMGTANGTTQGWRVKLNSVRVGSVTVHEVDAVVLPATIPYALLGNSFLTRFQMTRTNDQLVLERRY